MPALRAAGIAGVLLIAGFAAGRLGSEPLALGSYGLALVAGGWTFVPEAVKNLFHRRINIGSLMAFAAAGAVLLGEVGEAASLAFLFSISEALEAFALARARRSLRALLSIVPDTATVRRNGSEEQVGVAELVPGDLMLIRPGERVPTDGLIRTGRTAIDTSPVTGESVPVEAGPGETVYAGSINGNGRIGEREHHLAERQALFERRLPGIGHRDDLLDALACSQRPQPLRVGHGAQPGLTCDVAKALAEDALHLPAHVQKGLLRRETGTGGHRKQVEDRRKLHQDLLPPLRHPPLQLTISDNGRSFDPAGVGAVPSSFGLRNMRERAEALGGDLSIDSDPRSGTHIRVVVPLHLRPGPAK